MAGTRNIQEQFKGFLLKLIGLVFQSQSADPLSGSGKPHLWVKSGDKKLHYTDTDGTDNTLLAVGDIDFNEAGDVASVSTAKAAGTSVEVARADHVHDLAAGIAGAGLALNAGALDVGAGTGIDTNANDVAVKENFLRQQTTVLTNAQVLALRAAPITVVSAPGAGKWVELDRVVLVFDRTAAYTESADNLAVKYVDGSGAAASATIETTGFVDAGSDAITSAGPNGTPPIHTAAGELSNAALVIHNTGDGEFGGGNAANTIKVIVTYRIHTTGL